MEKLGLRDTFDLVKYGYDVPTPLPLPLSFKNDVPAYDFLRCPKCHVTLRYGLDTLDGQCPICSTDTTKKPKGGSSMGMFDYFRVEAPLPDPRFQHYEFQTNDLECCLHHYILDKDGNLSVERFRIDQDLAPPKPVNVTTAIYFCNYFYDDPDFTWVEFKATIVEGKLHGPIELVRLDRKKKP